MKRLYALIAAAALLALLLCACGKDKTPTLDQVPIHTVEPGPGMASLVELRKDYTAAQAEADGCMVIDGETLLAGEELWTEFVRATEAGEPAVIRIYQAYSRQSDRYFVRDLRYDGEHYLLAYFDKDVDTEQDILVQGSYTCLNQSVGQYDTGDLRFCMLADDPEVTGENYFAGLLTDSFQLDERYEHCVLLFSLNED